jgi:hypothetical protein
MSLLCTYPSLVGGKETLSYTCCSVKLRLPEPSNFGSPPAELGVYLIKLDENLHCHVRTTNHLERLFREFRTKSDEIGAFPHETSCLTVFFSLLSAIMPNMTVNL